MEFQSVFFERFKNTKSRAPWKICINDQQIGMGGA